MPTRPTIFWLSLTVGVFLGVWIEWFIATPAIDLSMLADGSYANNSAAASRARYLNARGGLDRAWGPWNAAIKAPGERPYVILGIDTAERCAALEKQIESATVKAWVLDKAEVECFQSVSAQFGTIEKEIKRP
jgi:hypothetical protein